MTLTKRKQKPRIMKEPKERGEFFGFLKVIQGDGNKSWRSENK
jgi:hypothetical protein